MANTNDPAEQKTPPKGTALVFGASGEQGRAVIDGLIKSSYSPVYGATRDPSTPTAKFITSGLHASKVLKVDLSDTSSVEQALKETKATCIFLVTTTDLPKQVGVTSGFAEAEEEEYQTIVSFFDAVLRVYESDGIERHVVFSTLDNVKAISYEGMKDSEGPFIQPLEDGSIAAHYSGKGRGGEYAIELLKNVEGVSLTLVTLPLLHSNFTGFATPLPDEGFTQWSISACFGNNSVVDMCSVSDLAYIVPGIFNEKNIYKGRNIRVSAEKITLDEVAATFANLFGRNVIYNPLTTEEMSKLPIPAAGCIAQMCQFLGDSRSSHDIDVTEAVMFPRKPQLFKDWLLINSDCQTFEKVALSMDAREIKSVAVFGATSLEGTSVVKGLLADKRKEYKIRATSRDITQPKALALKELDPDRVTLVQCDFDDTESCASAVNGVDGAFLVTDFFDKGDGVDPEVEERHARNIIDACEKSHSVMHLIFSTMESVAEMNAKLSLGMPVLEDKSGRKGVLPQFDAKARSAAYARTKRLSCTFILMPCYSEIFFDLLKPELQVNKETNEKKIIVSVPKKDNTKVMCMSVEELGPAVANIFDSYQVYAGHEIGLVTDFVSVSEATDIITEVLVSEEDEDGTETPLTEVEKREVDMDTWVEARDTYIKDLGQMFQYMSHTEAVQKRRNVAQTMELVPNAKPLRKWVEQNKDNVAFREQMGLR